MNYIKFTQTACRNVAALLVCVLLASCGSGGGGSNVTPMPQADKDAFQATAVAAYQTLGAGSSYPFAALKLSSPTGSGTHVQPAAILFSLSRAVAALSSAVSRAGVSAALNFDSSLNLYTDGGIFSGNVATISYYSDAAGTQPAGTVTITLPTDITNLTDPTSYASYPAVITMNVNITGGNLPCTGNGQITFTGGSGANTMTGTLTLTKTNVVFTLDLALSDQLNASGSITVTENGDTLQLTNVNGNPLSTLTCNVSVSPEGWTGTGTINLVTGAMTANLNTGTGATTVSSDSSGNLNIVYADGTTETVGTGGGNTISARATTTAQNLTVGTAMTSFSPLTASGGATPYTYSHTGTLPDGLSFSSSTGAVTGTPTAVYATASLVFSVKDANNVVASTTSTVSFTVGAAVPYTISAVNGNPWTIVSVTPDGQMVGAVGTYNTRDFRYWSSPTAAPQAITLDPGLTSIAVTGINSSGHMVGSGLDNTTNLPVLLYWSAYNQTPVRLASPPSPTEGIQYGITVPVFIQPSDRIVVTFGTQQMGVSVSYVYSGPTDTSPYMVTGGYVTSLSDGTVALGTGPDLREVVWPVLSATATPIVVPTPTSTGPAILGPDGSIVVSDLVTKAVWYETGSDYTNKVAVTPPTGSTVFGVVRIGPGGQLLGWVATSNTSLDDNGLIWNTPTSAPVVLRTTDTPNVLNAMFETTAGALIVYCVDTPGVAKYHFSVMTPK